MDFNLIADAPVSNAFKAVGVHSFKDAQQYVRQLPYGRNTDKTNLLTVFSDGVGTCSTKHALLKLLADEHGRDDVKLILGIVHMTAANTPRIAATLAKHNLPYLPEAHNYLSINGVVHDDTSISFTAGMFGTPASEVEITPAQVTDYKVAHHKAYLQQWLADNPAIPYTLSELYTIREQCIKDLGQ